MFILIIKGIIIIVLLFSEAIDEYGQAWVTQDPNRIARLFTKDGNDKSYPQPLALDSSREKTSRAKTRAEKAWRWKPGDGDKIQSCRKDAVYIERTFDRAGTFLGRRKNVG